MFKKSLSIAFFCVFLPLVFLAVLFEIYLGYQHGKQWEERVKQRRPYYNWSFHLSDGTRVGTKLGPLKLMIHPAIGYVNYPNQQSTYFTVNKDGFRGEVIPKERTSKKRIVIIGGSTAFGTGLKNDEDTMAALLPNLLPNVEVINAGVIGHRSLQELVYLTTELLEWKPDIVIVLDGINDYAQVEEENAWSAIGNNGFIQVERQLRKAHLLTSSPFWVRYANLGRVFFANIYNYFETLVAYKRQQDATAKLKVGEKPQSLAANDSVIPTMEEVVANYVSNIKTMQSLADAKGFKLLVALQPEIMTIKNGGPDADDRISSGYADFRSQVSDTLSRAGVNIVDLNENTDIFKGEMFMDRMHLDAPGNRELAKVFVSLIRQIPAQT